MKNESHRCHWIDLAERLSFASLHWMATQSEARRASAKAFVAWLILQGVGDERTFFTKFLSVEEFERSAEMYHENN